MIPLMDFFGIIFFFFKDVLDQVKAVQGPLLFPGLYFVCAIKAVKTWKEEVGGSNVDQEGSFGIMKKVEERPG